MLLSDISKVENESKNTDSEPGYAGYEMLDKYDRAYEEIKVVQPPKLPDRQELPSPRPPSSASDYVITQCPAYIPAAHGNQQGQEAETPLMQPAGTTAPKDSSVTVEDDETYWNVSAS